MFAYEGRRVPSIPDGDPAAVRSRLADQFVSDVLERLLDLWRIPSDICEAPVADVRMRLQTLLARWGTPQLLPLLAPFLIPSSRSPSGTTHVTST